MNQISSVNSDIAFLPSGAGDITTHRPYIYDYRKSDAERGSLGAEVENTTIFDARQTDDLGLEKSGFELVKSSSSVSDFVDNEEVMTVYYEECKEIARKLTGATVTFTYDHLIREPGRQISGGGTDGKTQITGVESGGGYIGFAHMDYTDNTTWSDYLAVHGETVPSPVSRVVSLNFWRGLSSVVDDYPLAVCDGRTVKETDLFETHVYGYGASNYSWHEVGIETYSVKFSRDQRWYFYPRMSPDEVLVIKSYDSLGVIGRTCPHCAFANPDALVSSPPRRSIELRVLCFITD